MSSPKTTRPRRRFGAIESFEQVLYGVAVVLLAATALVVVAGIATEAYHHIVDTTPLAEVVVSLIDQILLLLIIAELIHTIRIVLDDRRIHAELFLLIGLIVIVRRVVVVTAEAESMTAASEAFRNLIFELAALGFLAVCFGLVILILRSHPHEDHDSTRAHSEK